jgi:hypothetical protein
MDPYLEAQANWPDFHASVMTYVRDQLAAVLPDDYVARMEERVRLEAPDEETEVIRPDVLVARRRDSLLSAEPQAGVSTLEPVAVPFARTNPTLIRQRRVAIRHLPELSLVTVIKVLSPDDKGGKGRIDYLAKRELLIEQAVHLVEIDLLLGGRRLPMGAALPPGDYYAFVARVERWPSCDVYAWSVRDRLPTIPIPLRLPDPDVSLDLSAPVHTAYDRGLYGRTTDYKAALSLPLDEESRAWAEGVGRT